MGANNRWVYRIADGQLCMGEVFGGLAANANTDPSHYALIDLDDAAPWPSPRLHRAVDPHTIRPATAAEVAAFDAALKDVVATGDVSDKKLQALGIVVWQELQKCQPQNGQLLLTAQQFKDQLRATYRSLL